MARPRRKKKVGTPTIPRPEPVPGCITIRQYFTLSQALTQARIPAGKHPNDATDGRAFSSQLESNGKASSWDSGLDFPAALQAARDGLEPSRAFTLSANRFQRDQEITSVVYSYDVTGEELDYGRFLDGERECFLEPLLTTKPGVSPIVEILTSVAAAGCIDASTIERRGAAIYALCETLEKSGKAVGVTICAPSNGVSGGHTFDTHIRAKEPFEQMNARRMFYLLTHPTVLRRIYFRLMEQLEPTTRDALGVHFGYGRSRDIPAADIPAGALYIPSISHTDPTFESHDKTQAWVTGLLEAAGATIS